jgi:O-antigen/teichoic acid export membrane protein
MIPTLTGKFRRNWDRLTGHKIVRSIGLLAGGTVVAQAVVFLATPLLTRIYSPKDFGVLAVYASILGVVSVLSTLRYELAIPLARAENEIGALVVLCIFVVTTTTTMFAFVVESWGDFLLSRFDNITVILPYLWLLPVGVCLSGLYLTLSYLASSNKQFGAIGKTKVSQAIGMVAIQCGGGVTGSGGAGLIVGHIAGQCFGIGTLARCTQPRNVIRSVTLRQVGYAAINFWRFPVFTTTAALVNTLGTLASPLFLANCFGTAVSGSFFLTMRVLSIPAMLLGTAVNQVLYTEMAGLAYEKENLTQLLNRTATALLFIGAPFFCFIALWGKEIFVVCFGAKWNDAGVYAQILAPWLMVNFISSPISTLSMVKGKQRAAFLISMYETSLRIGGIFLGARFGNAIFSVGLYSAAGVIICSAFIAWTFRLSGGRAFAWLLSARTYVLALMLMSITLYVAKLLIPALFVFIASLCCFGVFYAWSAHTFPKPSQIA